MGKVLQTVAAMACLQSLLMVFNLAFWVSQFKNPFMEFRFKFRKFYSMNDDDKIHFQMNESLSK